jgi:hypothetical protein
LLTKEDIKAFRKSSIFYFRYQPDFMTTISAIDCAIVSERDGQYVEVSYRIPTNGGVKDFDGATPDYIFDTYGTGVDACCTVTEYEWEAGTIKTIGGLLRVNDILRLEWHRNNNSEAIERQDFATDTLGLQIARGKKELFFIIKSRTANRHSESRMIKRKYEKHFESRAWLAD